MRIQTNTHPHRGRHLSLLPHLCGNEILKQVVQRLFLKNQSILGKSNCIWGHSFSELTFWKFCPWVSGLGEIFIKKKSK